MSAAWSAAIAIAARRVRIVRALIKAGAVSAETARSPDELGMDRGLVFRRMLKSGVVKEASGNRVWLDQAAYAESRWRTLLYVAAALVLVALGIAAVILLVR